jgi:hypothetical protein
MAGRIPVHRRVGDGLPEVKNPRLRGRIAPAMNALRIASNPRCVARAPRPTTSRTDSRMRIWAEVSASLLIILVIHIERSMRSVPMTTRTTRTPSSDSSSSLEPMAVARPGRNRESRTTGLSSPSEAPAIGREARESGGRRSPDRRGRAGTRARSSTPAVPTGQGFTRCSTAGPSTIPATISSTGPGTRTRGTATRINGTAAATAPGEQKGPSRAGQLPSRRSDTKPRDGFLNQVLSAAVIGTCLRGVLIGHRDGGGVHVGAFAYGPFELRCGICFSVALQGARRARVVTGRCLGLRSGRRQYSPEPSGQWRRSLIKPRPGPWFPGSPG